ncbi:MAG: putative metal-binding motif-containing protein, partial [Deltaproteobacteria bacterium]|nr:putative metal-binding motif-containing protein [Deltaproteobacteria bacterium]MBW2530608.1 putative metal-binding motif-containing protein [Deltaproteobacteria bacterium]
MAKVRAVSSGRGLLAGALTLIAAAAVAGPGCGGRSKLYVPPPLPPEPECAVDEDCPGYDDLCAQVICVDPNTYEGELPPVPPGFVLPPMVCVGLEPVDCDDEDHCTEDLCEPETGQCYYLPVTLDSDDDGHYAPLPGTVAGAPGSCGDDCNDASADAFPDNPEVCDGVDNDCNGVVDDGADFLPVGVPVRISSDALEPAEPGGLAYNGESYLAMYSGTSLGFDMYETRLDVDGTKLPPIEQPVGLQNADSYGGPIVWTGDRYGLSWEDRRDSDYEIYFTLLDGGGTKLIADTRLTNAFGFSVNNDMTWSGDEFLVVWQDERNGLFEVMGQRVNVDGVPIGSNVTLSPEQGFDDEEPSVDVGTPGYGLAFRNGDSYNGVIRFRIFDLYTLEPITELLDLTDGSTNPVDATVAWNQDHFVVAWRDKSPFITQAIYAATIGADGLIIQPATAISSPGPYRSRDPQILPLGDRSLLVYADDRDDENAG